MVAPKFKLESDLRRWVREEANDIPWWIEPSQGSTIGLPDCVIPWGNRAEVVWLELKVATWKDDRLIYEVRPKQRDQIRTMVEASQRVALLVGVKDTPIVMALRPTEAALAGRIDRVRDMFNSGQLRFCGNGSSLGGAPRTKLGLIEISCWIADGPWPFDS